MCGVAGYAIGKLEVGSPMDAVLAAMGAALTHRGPDDQGAWVHPRMPLGLVHRRLAIQDLSPLGNQPMISPSGRYILAFNGEIYNFRRLRAQLEDEGFSFDGGSDTEVILAAFDAWGVKAALARFNGMFAMALVDSESEQLWLIRDRLGEKPLYLYHNADSLVFGSELKALMACPVFERKVDPSALALLLKHNYIPGPSSIFQNTIKLPPAHYARFELGDISRAPELRRYWSPSLDWDLSMTRDSLHQRLEPLLKEVIADQMISDAPLGAFLSGGIDSSTIVALMQSQAAQSVKTFSVGFDIPGFNEAEHAKAVAEHLGTDHTEYYVQPQDALSIIPDLPRLYDEPFADSSQIPTFIVSRMTRQAVTVALSGDGGDELFAGYERYSQYQRAYEQRRSGLVRKLLSRLPMSLSAQLAGVAMPGQRGLSAALLREKVRRYRAAYASKDPLAFYSGQVAYWLDPSVVLPGVEEAAYALHNLGNRADAISSYQWADINTYLPDDILVKVDRAAMANSLETRVPLLDHRLVELALQVPTELNFHEGLAKWPLRRILYQHVPRELVERPKQGFAIPKAHWLRHELRDWAESLLSEQALAATGYFNIPLVRAAWRAHQKSGQDYSFHLWSVLMFQAWHREYLS